MSGIEMKPCPFCGREVDLDDPDTLYPNGILWRARKKGSMFSRSYHGIQERRPDDHFCYSMHCPSNAGGCGVEMPADSREEAIELWNRRS